MTASATLLADAEALAPEIVALRRAIHAEPELGLHTVETSRKLRKALEGLPVEIRESRSTSGFTAVLKGKHGSRHVLLRADTDALPLDETVDLPFASRIPGAMHACGHDAHAAMLVGAARLLARHRHHLNGTVTFMFQPGEEGHHGARFMIDDGLLDPLPDAAFALHVMPGVEVGHFCGKAGTLLAAADHIRIIVKGRGAHASTPFEGLDPVPLACEVAIALQTFATRAFSVFEPVVITVGSIQSGSAYNIIPDEAILDVSLRSLSAETRNTALAGISRLATGIAAAHGASASVECIDGFPPTVCDTAAVALGRAAVSKLLGAGAWSELPTPFMNSEDFSYILERVPGAMFMLGVGGHDDGAACCPLHSSGFRLDENALDAGVALLSCLALDFLADEEVR